MSLLSKLSKNNWPNDRRTNERTNKRNIEANFTFCALRIFVFFWAPLSVSLSLPPPFTLSPSMSLSLSFVHFYVTIPSSLFLSFFYFSFLHFYSTILPSLSLLFSLTLFFLSLCLALLCHHPFLSLSLWCLSLFFLSLSFFHFRFTIRQLPLLNPYLSLSLCLYLSLFVPVLLIDLI